MNKTNPISQQPQEGVTMLEMMLVSAVIGILLLLATRYYETTHYSSQTNEVLKSIQTIYAAKQQYCNDNDCTSGDTKIKPSLDNFKSSGFLPANFGSTIGNPWGSIADANYTPPTYSATFSGVPYTACTNLKQIIASNYSASSSSAAEIQIPTCPSAGTDTMTVNFQ